MSLYWSLPVAFAIGVALSQQAAINAASSQVLNSAFAAAAFSLAISTVVVLFLFMASAAPTQPASLMALPWWAVLAGLIGAVFVSGGAMLVPVMGVTLFFLCLIAGQLVGSVIADSIGAFGVEQKSLTLRKLAGVALAFAGVLLVRLG